MPNTNRITIEGHLGADPQYMKTQNGKDLANCTIAVSDKKKVQGEWVNDHTEWFYVTVWGKQALELAQLKKGDTVCIPEGKIKTRSWTDKNSGEKKYMPEVHAFRFYSRPKQSVEEYNADQPASLPQGMEDIPF